MKGFDYTSLKYLNSISTAFGWIRDLSLEFTPWLLHNTFELGRIPGSSEWIDIPVDEIHLIVVAPPWLGVETATGNPLLDHQYSRSFIDENKLQFPEASPRAVAR